MKIETIRCGQSNVYLVHGENGKAVLIDTGTSGWRDKVLECCQEADVGLIILTHGHFDHCQSAAYLAGKLNCPVGIAEEDVPLLEVHQKRKVFGKGIWGRFYAWASNRNIRTNEIEAVAPGVILEEGMSLSEYGVDGNIVKLAGHTKGSIGVRLSTGELFVGDAMQNILFPAVTWCYEDEEQAGISARRIQNMDVTKLFFGHGRPKNGYLPRHPSVWERIIPNDRKGDRTKCCD